MTYSFLNSSLGIEMVSPTFMPPRFGGPPVARFHDARAAARADDEAAFALVERLRPFGEPRCQSARGLVVAGHLQIDTRSSQVAVTGLGALQACLRFITRQDPCGTHENDRVAHMMVLKPAVGFEILGKDSQCPGVLAAEESFVVVSVNRLFGDFVHRVSSFMTSRSSRGGSSVP